MESAIYSANSEGKQALELIEEERDCDDDDCVQKKKENWEILKI